MNPEKAAETMLEIAFKTGYEAGYIDDEGYLLKSIPMEDFNALNKYGMIVQKGFEFKLQRPDLKKA